MFFSLRCRNLNSAKQKFLLDKYIFTFFTKEINHNLFEHDRTKRIVRYVGFTGNYLRYFADWNYTVICVFI